MKTETITVTMGYGTRERRYRIPIVRRLTDTLLIVRPRRLRQSVRA